MLYHQLEIWNRWFSHFDILIFKFLHWLIDPPWTCHATENFEILKEPKTELLEVSEEDAADLFNLALDQEEVENHEEEYIDQRLESVS